MMIGLGMRRIGSAVRRKRSGEWEVSERLYSTVRENSIDFLEKLYRLFSDTSEQTLGLYGSNDLFVWEQCSVSSEEKSANVRSGAWSSS